MDHLPVPTAPGHVVMLAPKTSRVVRHRGDWTVLPFDRTPENGTSMAFVAQPRPDHFSHLLEA